MKHSIKFSLLGGVLLFSLSMCLTSCEGALDDVLGEWSRPTPGNNTNTTPTTSSTYRVYTSGTSYTDEALPTSGVTTEANITNTWTGDIVIGADKTLDGDVTLSGDVNLIIKDGAELKVNGQILGASNDLKIYGQSESTGKLTVDVADQYNICVKNLEVHGCVIKGTSADQSIENSSSGTIKIYNGTVDVTGDSNGIMALGDFTIYGGKVTTNSTNGPSISLYVSNLSIEGGTVTATSGKGDAILSSGTSGSINISGGTVTATGGTNSPGNGGHGISISNGNISISGSTTSVTAIGGDGGTGAMDSGGNGLFVNKADATIVITGGTINATAGNATGAGGYAIYAFDLTTNNAAVIFNGGCDVTATATGTNGVGIRSNILTVSGSATTVNATGNNVGILTDTTPPSVDFTINDGTVFGKATADGSHGIYGNISYIGGVLQGEGGSGGYGIYTGLGITNNSGAAITVGYKSTSGVDWTGEDVPISDTTLNFDRYMIMPKP